MKKYLPYILLGVGLLVVVVAFVVVRGRKEKAPEGTDDETALIELSPEERPVVSLTPTDDGHYLTLRVEKIDFKPHSVDYLLLYNTAEDVQQGVPGTVSLEGTTMFEEKLLLGSESSGKFRYDEGVETGLIELSFRNEEGKLLIKFETDFHMQTNSSELSTVDGSFSKTFDDLPEEVFFVTMHTVGTTDTLKAFYIEDEYAIFSSDSNLTSSDF